MLHLEICVDHVAVVIHVTALVEHLVFCFILFFCSIRCMQIVLQRVGPWGGDGGRDHDIMVAPRRLESVKVCSGVVVDTLGFSYRDKYGKQHRTPLWGGLGGEAVRTVSKSISLGPTKINLQGKRAACFFIDLFHVQKMG